MLMVVVVTGVKTGFGTLMVRILKDVNLAHATHWAQLTTRVATFTRESAHVSVT
jgi:hypothetical protein